MQEEQEEQEQTSTKKELREQAAKYSLSCHSAAFSVQAWVFLFI